MGFMLQVLKGVAITVKLLETSTGERIEFKLSFKPTSSVLDLAKKGRHDPCIVPRAIPVLESMIWLVLAKHILWMRLDRV